MKKSIGSGRGSVYNIILKALQSGDKYGYEICKEVEEKTNGAYILKQPSLYSGLKRLEAQGDVRSYWRDSVLGGRRHYYSLTESGRDRIERSNFNWQDARDEIVGNLFEKSQVDETIESVESQINDLKSISTLNEDTQKDIDEVIKSTENLYKESSEQEKYDKIQESVDSLKDVLETESTKKDIEDAEVDEEQVDDLFKINDAGGDLFSIFNNLNTNVESHESAVQSDSNTEDNRDEGKFEDETVLVEEDTSIHDENEESISEEDKIPHEISDEIFEFKNSIDNGPKADGLNEAKMQEELSHHDEDVSNTAAEVYFRHDNTNYSKQEENKTKSEQLDLFSFASNVNNNENDVEHAEAYSTGEIETEQKNENNTGIFNVQSESDKETVSTTSEIFAHEVILEKNENDVLSEYRKQNVGFGSYGDSSMLDDESSMPNFFGQEQTQQKNVEPAEKNKEVFENEVECANLMTESQTSDNNSFETHGEELNSLEDKVLNNEPTDEDIESKKGLDYKNIFGDLMSSKSKVAELDDEFVYNSTKESGKIYEDEGNAEIYANKQSYSPETHEHEFDNHNQKVADLPRDEEAIKDINRTLFLDDSVVKASSSSYSDFESYDQTPFKETNSFVNSNPFERYDTYQSIEESHNINDKKNTEHNNIYSNRPSNMAFDKKYANSNNRFDVPDYEVRYYKKYDEKVTMSKYLSINKLNLVKSFIFSILICIITTLTLVVASSNVEVKGFQMFLFITSYLIGFGTLIYNFLKYNYNKHKKVPAINKTETMFNIFLAIGLVILAIVINITSGMNSSNIFGYFASFILPIFYSVLFILNYPLKKFLSKFASFYSEK